MQSMENIEKIENHWVHEWKGKFWQYVITSNILKSENGDMFFIHVPECGIIITDIVELLI